ncbi:hypothetical protein J6590_021436 [Homalodisca vitripennis]|nr:hypothetical protein J6590_021436 [Homalodisca vitripennis]
MVQLLAPRMRSPYYGILLLHTIPDVSSKWLLRMRRLQNKILFSGFVELFVRGRRVVNKL